MFASTSIVQRSNKDTEQITIAIYCFICSEAYENSQVMALKCGHIFHHNCLTLWFQLGKTCPTCNAKTSMANAFLVFLDNKTQGGDSNRNRIPTDRPASTVFVNQMKKRLEITNRKNNIGLKSSVLYIYVLEVIILAVFVLSYTIIDGYLESAIDLMYENIAMSRYSMVLDLFIEQNLGSANLTTANDTTLRDKYIYEKEYNVLRPNTLVLSIGSLQGAVLGPLSLIVFILYKKYRNQPFLGKIQGHQESNKVEQFLYLIKELEKVYDNFYVVLRMCVASGVIYTIIIGAGGPFCMCFRNQIRNDYASLLRYNFTQFQPIVEQNHDTTYIQSIDFFRKQYEYELMTNETDQIFLNTIIFLFTTVGAFFIITFCTFGTAHSQYKRLTIIGNINKVINGPYFSGRSGPNFS